MLMAALRYVDVPGYAAVVFRRTYPQLTASGGLLPRAQEWLAGTGAVWNGQTHTWTFPSGARLSFGAMQHEEDKYQWKGAEFAFVGFEEASEFEPSQLDYLRSRLRRPRFGPVSAVPLRMRYTSNPGGPGHEWLRERFVRHRNDRWRVFIPAGLADNPHLGPEYRAQLEGLADEVEKARLLHGDWDATGGGTVFQREWFEVLDAAPSDVVRRVRGWDFAATRDAGCATVGARWAKTASGLFVVEDLVVGHWDPGARDEVVLATAAADGPDVEVDWEQEPGSAGKDTKWHLTQRLAGYRTWGTPSTGDKVTRAGAWASQAKLGRVKLLRGEWNGRFLNAVQRFPEAFRDEIDACSVAFRRLTQGWDGRFFA